MLGGPGSGKGTQCQKACDVLNIHHISAGELLRNEVRTDSVESKLISTHLVEGKIVPAAITARLLFKTIGRLSPSIVLVDGFPRNQDNYETWESMISSHSDSVDSDVSCLFISCPDQELIARLQHRGRSSGRSDDNSDTITKRLEVFKAETLPVVDLFHKHHGLHSVDGTGTTEEVHRRFLNAIQNSLKGKI